MSHVEKTLVGGSVATGLASTNKIVPGKYILLSRYADTEESMQTEFRLEVRNEILSKKVSTELRNQLFINFRSILWIKKFLYKEMATC